MFKVFEIDIHYTIHYALAFSFIASPLIIQSYYR